MSLDPVIYNQVALDKDGNREIRIGDIHLTSKPIPGRDLVCDSSVYLRSAYPKIEARFPDGPLTPNWTLIHADPANTNGTNQNLRDYGRFVMSTSGVMIWMYKLQTGASNFKRSTDGGVTWTAPTVTGVTADNFQIYDICFGGPTGETLMVTCNNGITTGCRMFRSTDYGNTWTTIATNIVMTSSAGAYTLNNRIPLPTVSRFLYANNTWFHMIRGTTAGQWDIHTSTDDGLTFTKISSWQASLNTTYYPRMTFVNGRLYLFAARDGTSTTANLIDKTWSDSPYTSWASTTNINSLVSTLPQYLPQDFLPYGFGDTGTAIVFLGCSASGTLFLSYFDANGSQTTHTNGITALPVGASTPRIFKTGNEIIGPISDTGQFFRARYMNGYGRYVSATPTILYCSSTSSQQGTGAINQPQNTLSETRLVINNGKAYLLAKPTFGDAALYVWDFTADMGKTFIVPDASQQSGDNVAYTSNDYKAVPHVYCIRAA